jgi:hypothetical protein
MLCRVIANCAGQITRIRFDPIPAFVHSHRILQGRQGCQAFTPPALLQGRNQASNGGALAFDVAGGRL